MKQFFIYLFAAVLATSAVAQTPVDSAKVYFRLGHRHYEPAFGGNAKGMRPFIEEVRRQKAADNIERIIVRSYASPDGSNAANTRLSRNRCQAITQYLLAETGLSPLLVHTEAEGIAWDELRRMVAADDRVPYREEVLEVLDNTPLWIFDNRKRVTGGRKQSLMALRAGVPYRWLYNNIFPKLRNAVAVSLYVKHAPEPEPVPADSVKPVPAGSDTIVTPETDTPDNLTPATTDTGTAGNADDGGFNANAAADYEPYHRLAVKTNLLYDAVLMPSLEVEYRFNDRWTLNVEGNLAWWKNDGKHKYYQILTYSPEGRYWFKNYRGRPWHGHYVGLFAGGGKYDLENGRRGYYGEGVFTGLSYGFMFPVARNLSFEAGIGVGYLYTRYKEYLPIEGHYVYQQTSRTHYFGPLKLKFALVWRLWDVNKSKKGVNHE